MSRPRTFRNTTERRKEFSALIIAGPGETEIFATWPRVICPPPLPMGAPPPPPGGVGPRHAAEDRLDHVVDVVHVEAIPRGRFPVGENVEVGPPQCPLGDHVHRSRNLFER